MNATEKSLAPYLIGLDLGTSAIKSVLTDARGTVLAEAEAPNKLLRPCDGWVEFDPEAHYRNVCSVIRKLATSAPGTVSAVAMAAASGNTLLTRANGEPLTPVISWLDQRAATSPLAALQGLAEQEVRQITGWPCLTGFPLAHLAWLREHEPELLRSAGHVGMDTDWLLHRLTGAWVMDHSTATTFHLQNQLTGAYHAPYLERLGLEPQRLSALTQPGVEVGPLTAQAAADTGLSERTVVVTGSFDHPAAARAVGVLEPGQFMFSCGTSWVGFLPQGNRQLLIDAGLLCDPFLSEEMGAWAGMFSVVRLGNVIDWYVQQVIAPNENDQVRVFDEAAGEAAPGAGGLTIDLTAPPQHPRASRANVSRAVMEAAARLLYAKLRELRAHGVTYRHAVMVGGPARSPVWPGIVADITGLEVTAGGRSAGARGAAVLAGIGCGAYRDARDAFATRSDFAIRGDLSVGGCDGVRSPAPSRFHES